MEWGLIAKVTAFAAVIVIKVAIVVGCYCYAKNKRCPVYKRRQERLNNNPNRPDRINHANYPKQQQVPPNTEDQYNSQFGKLASHNEGRVKLEKPSIPGSM